MYICVVQLNMLITYDTFGMHEKLVFNTHWASKLFCSEQIEHFIVTWNCIMMFVYIQSSA